MSTATKSTATAVAIDDVGNRDQPGGFCESVGNKIDNSIHGFFLTAGNRFVASRPKTTIICCVLFAAVCASGLANFATENRNEELWVPQDTTAEAEENEFLSFFPRTARFQQVILEDSSSNNNVLTKRNIKAALQLHQEIASTTSTVDGIDYTLSDLCVQSGGSCVSGTTANEASCGCLLEGLLRQWNYDPNAVDNQTDAAVLATASTYGSREDLEGVLGNPTFDSDGNLLSAESLALSYFLTDRSVTKDGSIEDPINEEWEQAVFLDAVQSVEGEDGTKQNNTYDSLTASYLAERSFNDEFGDAINGDIIFVQVSYIVTFAFLGATLGHLRCGPGSRRGLSFATLVMIGMSTIAGFGVASAIGLFFGPVHSLLPFILLGIGVDDAFVIVNAFDRERKVSRKEESDEDIAQRGASALARAGASITVTSLTDLVAFAISSSSALPALASFCAYASICIAFLWLFAATFFTAIVVMDEKRQKAGRRDVFCWRKGRRESGTEISDNQEKFSSRYFRNYHSSAILSKPGKAIVLAIFSGILGFGVFGALNLSVEDSSRNFIPSGSYINDFIDVADEYFPSSGADLYITFEGRSDIYSSRAKLAAIDTRLVGLSEKAPYIAEPTSEDTYQNVMSGFFQFLQTQGSSNIGGAALGDDGWPTTEEGFESALLEYSALTGPGAKFAQDVSFDDTTNELRAFRVKLEYVRLTKEYRGETVDDAGRQIDAMDETRDLIESWTDLPDAFPYSGNFLRIESFKIIRRELFMNVGLAIVSVAIIVLATVGNVVTTFLITINVAFCIIEILGFMYAAGIVIDSVSVINIVLAVGLSVDYSAHVGHCFMTKGGSCKDERVAEALADIGAAVLNGAITTFLAVAVLLFSSSYVFSTLSTQFALTVALGVLHGLVLLPVLLSLFGPRPFASTKDAPSNPTASKEHENQEKTHGNAESNA